MKRWLCGVWLAAASLALGACGANDNIFSEASEGDKSAKDKAQSAFTQGDYDQAISELEKYLAENPNDATARTMLASASLKKAGIDELQFAQRLTEAGEDTTAFSSATAMMPEPTEANIASLAKAKAALEAIPEENRTEEQNYQLAVASFSLGMTVVKKFTDSSGTVDEAKVETVTEADAELVTSALATTSDALAGVSSLGGQDSGNAASKLSELSSDLAAQPGSTDRERLQAFLQSQ